MPALDTFTRHHFANLSYICYIIFLEYYSNGGLPVVSVAGRFPSFMLSGFHFLGGVFFLEVIAQF